MPSDEEIRDAWFTVAPFLRHSTHAILDTEPIRALIRAAVERALAERKTVKEVLDTGGEWRTLEDGEIEMLMRATIPDLIEPSQDAARDRLSRLIVTAHDHMTERRKAERALHEQEARWISALKEVNGEKIYHPDFRKLWAKAEGSPSYWAELLRLSMEAYREQEQRHKREVLEAKISALMDFRVEIGNETGLDDALAMYLTYIRAELAALEVRP